MSESISEMSEDAAVSGGGLLDIVFDAACELAGERCDWVPVPDSGADRLPCGWCCQRKSSSNVKIWE